MPRWLLPNQPLGQTFSARLVCSKGVVQPGIVDRAAVAVVVQKLIVVVGNNVSVVTPVLLPLPLLSALLGRSVYELHDHDVDPCEVLAVVGASQAERILARGAAGGGAVAERGRGERRDRGRSDKRENDESGKTARWHEGRSDNRRGTAKGEADAPKGGRRLAHHTPLLKIAVWWRRAVVPSLPWVVCFLSFFI